MFLFLHKIPANFRVVATAVFVALISEPSASAQEQWGFAEGTIVSSDEHKLSVRPDEPSQLCADCAVMKKGESIEFLTDGGTRIKFRQYDIRPVQVSNFKRFDSLLFRKQGKSLIVDDLSLEDPKPGVIEAIEKNEPRPPPSPLAAALASQEHDKNGRALQNKGDINGAIREYREAIRLYPYSGQPHNNLGNALRSQGDHDGALKEYEVALRLEPDYKIAHYNIAIELDQRGLVKQAAAHYKAACPKVPSTYCPATPQGPSFEEQCAKDLDRCHFGLVYPATMVCEAMLRARGCKTD